MTLYPKTGPFVAGVTGLPATCLNNIETYLEYAADSNITSDGNGHLLVGQTVGVPNNGGFRGADSGGQIRQIMQLDGSNVLNIQAGGADQIRLKLSGGSEMARIDSSGLDLRAGTFSLLTGSISRISAFSGTASVTATLFNHGLGAVPDIVLLQLTINSTTAHMVSYFNDASLTSTQVKIISDGTNSFVGLAIKF